MKTSIACTFLAGLLVACAGGLGSDFPAQTESDRAYAAFALMKPGEPEGLIREHFEPSTTAPLRTYAIVDLERYVAEGHSARTYWIGYQYIEGTRTVTERVAAIRVVNGLIESVYYP